MNGLILYDKTVNPKDLLAYKSAFLESAHKHIESLESNLNLLKTNNPTPEIIEDLYLHLHSLKGECGVMKLAETVEKCEASLEFLRQEKQILTDSQSILSSIEENIKSIKADILSFENETPNNDVS